MQRLKVNMQGFREVVKALSKISGKNFEEVLKAEVGAVLKKSISSTPQGSIKGRRRGGKIKGGIVPQLLPESVKHQGGTGNKMITKQEGHTYHVGRPVILRINPDERRGNLGTNYRKRLRIKGNSRSYKSPSGRFPMRGGKVYSYPKGPWMGKSKFWGIYVPQQMTRANRKIKSIGLAGGQFYWQAQALGIQMTGRVKGKKWISQSSVGNIIRKFIHPNIKSDGTSSVLRIETRGLKLNANPIVNGSMRIEKAAKSRVSFFNRAVKNNWINDLKEYMPKNYPLIIK